jgi:class 3 adenylate cyclase/tetratricopeptide (TPR) repeat protein
MCGVALGDLPPERRKLATLLFCDLSGSTAMGERIDAESVRELMFRYFHTMRAALERHGGTVEKFIGDAVVAVFGVPVAHEDDALRAVRAAAEMRDRLAELNVELRRRFDVTIAVRIGLNTGEVVAGGRSATASIVTGDTVNVAARLEQAAAADEILLGELTHRLVRRAVSSEPAEPVQAKGKIEPIPAYRLLSVAPSSAPKPRQLQAELVGRADELQMLERLFERAVGERRALVVPVIGEPGVGKSRLAEELSSRIAGRARMLAGRCLSYGEGITFWPLVEIVRQAAGIRDEHTPGEARERIGALAPGEVAERVGAIVGLGGDIAADEVGWTVRRLFEALAARQPLLVLVEDVHWAEPLLLDLLGEVADRVRAPILLLCTARPELSAQRPGWQPPVRLEPLAAGDARGLVDALARRLALPDELAAKVAATTGGNPLFAEELALLLAEDPTASLPASVNAVLTARLDRLPEHERAAGERASVEGEIFHRGAVVALSPERERARVGDALDGLVADEVIRPARSDFADDAAFRFKHALVRDAAYNGTAKKVRAELHERFAEWLERSAGARVAEYEEVLGYHLEQAHGYLTELGPLVEHGHALGRRAVDRLTSAAEHAAARGAPAAAADLAGRALSLDDGRDADAKVRRVAAAAEYHMLAGDDRRAHELLQSALVDSPAGPRRARLFHGIASCVHNVDQAIAALESALAEVGDDARLEAEVISHLAQAISNARNVADAEPYARTAVAAAERAGDPTLLASALSTLAATEFFLGRGVPAELMERALALEPECESLTIAERPVTRFGWMCKWGGDIDRSRILLGEALRMGEERGDSRVAEPLFYSCYLALLAEDWQRGLQLADRLLESGFELERDDLILCGFGARATLLAHLGDESGTRRDVREALALDGRTGLTHGLKFAGYALGTLEPSLDRPSEALSLLRQVRETDFAEGVEEPAMHFSFPRHAEAAIAAGELGEAEEVLDWIEERAVRLDREWALACAARGRGLLAAARGDEAGAAEAFERALTEHARVQYRRFDFAQTLLAQGQTLRRFGREQAARDAIEAATAIFDELGAALWAAKARRDSERLTAAATPELR